jgi:hypothetical protein
MRASAILPYIDREPIIERSLAVFETSIMTGTKTAQSCLNTEKFEWQILKSTEKLLFSL